ncbi:MAG: hypothetical protein QXL22_06450 [Candidatus Nezhaarchaeales archaeon]
MRNSASRQVRRLGLRLARQAPLKGRPRGEEAKDTAPINPASHHPDRWMIDPWRTHPR